MSRLTPFRVVVCLVVFVFVPRLQAGKVTLASLTISPSTFTAGYAPTVTATLTGAAPKNGGAAVTVTSSNQNVLTGPFTINIAGGATSGSANIASYWVTSNTNVTLTGSYNNTTASATATVTPVTVYQTVNLSPQELTAPNTTTATVYINGYAPAGGAVVSLTSSSASAPVPATVTVPYGSSNVSFPIATSQPSNGQDVVTITATMNGTSGSGTLYVDPCSLGQMGIPPPNVRDYVWIDDATPQGGVLTGGSWSGWAATNPATGNYYLTTPNAPGAHDATITGATATMTVGSGDNLMVYLLPTRCAPTREIVLGWHTTSGVWKKAYFGTALIGGEAGMVSLGAIPNQEPLAWRRIEIPSTQLGLDGATIDGFTIQCYDGQVFADHIGRYCPQALVAAPTIPATDTIRIDDSLTGGYMYYGTFDPSQHASGTQSLISQLGGTPGTAAPIDIFITGSPMTVHIGESLSLYALGGVCQPPTEVLVTYHTTTGESPTVFWGTPHHASGETTSLGPVPGSAQWTRLSVPAASIGLEGKTIQEITITTYDGVAWFDAIGHSASTCVTSTAAAPAISANDVTWVNDSAGLGNGGVWDTAQHADGTQSLTKPGGGDNTNLSFTVTPATNTAVAFNEGLVFYVLLDPCAPPSEIAVTWTDSNNAVHGVWAGVNHNLGGESSGWSGFTFPQAGTWTRVEIPTSVFNLEGLSVNSINAYFYGGKAWFDHFAKYPQPCATPRQSQPSPPPPDETWFDDGNVAALASFDMYDTSQSATGVGSYTQTATSGYQYQYTQFLNISRQVGYGDIMVYYLLIGTCSPTYEVLARWQADGATHGAYFGSAGFGGEGTYYFRLGDLPPQGVWTRVEIPASQLGIEGKTVSDFDVVNTYGKVWVDHVGRIACTWPAPSQPALPGTDTVWIDDAVPPGASSTIVWSSQQAASGTQSMGGPVDQSFNTTNVSFAVDAGDKLVMYLLSDPCKPASEVVLDVTTADGINVRAYWGTLLSYWDAATSVNMGAVPAAGQWQRLEVPASALGIEGKTVTAIKTEYIGHAWLDRIGKSQ